MYYSLLRRLGCNGLVFGGLELHNTITRAFGLMIKSREIELVIIHGQKIGSQSAGLQAA